MVCPPRCCKFINSDLYQVVPICSAGRGFWSEDKPASVRIKLENVNCRQPCDCRCTWCGCRCRGCQGTDLIGQQRHQGCQLSDIYILNAKYPTLLYQLLQIVPVAANAPAGGGNGRGRGLQGQVAPVMGVGRVGDQHQRLHLALWRWQP